MFGSLPSSLINSERRSQLSLHIWKLLFLTSLVTTASYAADEYKPDIWVPMHAVDDDGTMNTIGRVGIRQVGSGVEFRPHLGDLAPGLHGFHIHESPSCEPADIDGELTPAGAAGDHLDPMSHDDHASPWRDGHLGDLPALYVSDEGAADHSVFKPGITLDDIRGRALVIHEDGDTYTNEPDSSGGGGARVACGVVPGA